MIRKAVLSALISASFCMGAAQAIEVTETFDVSGLRWDVAAHGGAKITVAGPNGYTASMEFKAGETLSMDFASFKNLTDGQYTYELTLTPAAKSERGGAAGQGGLTSGSFTVDQGSIVDRNMAENVAKDQQILDDLIVDGSACIGQDCVNGESFGFDTIRIKENNLRIKAQDTSSTASFPSNDWQLTFNDSSNGGANKFSIDDIDGGRTPFTIEAGTPSHSLYADSSGRIGFGTSTPVADLHVKSGNTPTLRLEQDGTSGFAAQIWDLAGNEANLFLRDASNGSTLPFRLFPGAPSNALNIAADGDVGLGTTTPNGQAQLHVLSNGTNREVVHLARNGNVGIVFNDLSATSGTDVDDWSMGTTGGFDFSIAKVNTGTVLEAKTNGDVEIPNGNLIVGGTQVTVPDYVFEDSYHLRTIAELAAFIDANGHLPGVTSAAEVAANGFNMTQMQLQMLEKIEELALYTIEQHTQIERLNAEISALRSQ